ncbi:hypothetical protein PVK06_036994 [Gossypium arboreum]|uniref:RNase H type-1 domain-containing protein n=1 Tax=Gossypium arboreum TaxID=29729 RepID=A0ABR0NM43_GOSAR|nr:hypothetical protein PVK06_036994 [Gossypium arboreum]
MPRASLFDWLCILLLGSDVDRLEKVAVTLWSLWYFRNSAVWKASFVPSQQVVSFAASFMQDWAASRSAYGRLKGLSLAPFSAATVWSPPLAGLVECNVDAAIGHTARVSSFAAMVRNDYGDFVKAVSGCCSAMFSPCVAEATSVREAFSWLKVESFDSVLVQMDCLDVCTALQSPREDCSELQYRNFCHELLGVRLW